ncbi:MAG: MerR family transcriptional regulator [Clostridiales bacterium]|nr:MerR family transcriptional regulator [Clostridiales bacterium]
MEAMSISLVSRCFGVSARMLRYYEQAGLNRSFRREDYAYRMYDKTALSRLSLILILRKLRIPVKQIRTILQKPEAAAAVEIFMKNISELDDEITALSTIREILSRLVDALRQKAGVRLHDLIAQDCDIPACLGSLPSESINFREDKTMNKLKTAHERLSKLTDVRIVFLPPSTIAAARYIEDEPENRAQEMIDDFVRKSGLSAVKPDLRLYGFNHPNPVDETGFHGYEMWVAIPDDIVVPPPLEKKRFAGGFYNKKYR